MPNGHAQPGFDLTVFLLLFLFLLIDFRLRVGVIRKDDFNVLFEFYGSLVVGTYILISREPKRCQPKINDDPKLWFLRTFIIIVYDHPVVASRRNFINEWGGCD